MPDTPVERDHQGFSRQFIESLPPRTAIVDRGEPSARELALLSWSKTREERRQFHESIARIVAEINGGDHR